LFYQENHVAPVELPRVNILKISISKAQRVLRSAKRNKRDPRSKPRTNQTTKEKKTPLYDVYAELLKTKEVG
jgi:hypothetical protein